MAAVGHSTLVPASSSMVPFSPPLMNQGRIYLIKSFSDNLKKVLKELKDSPTSESPTADSPTAYETAKNVRAMIIHLFIFHIKSGASPWWRVICLQGYQEQLVELSKAKDKEKEKKLNESSLLMQAMIRMVAITKDEKELNEFAHQKAELEISAWQGDPSQENYEALFESPYD